MFTCAPAYFGVFVPLRARILIMFELAAPGTVHCIIIPKCTSTRPGQAITCTPTHCTRAFLPNIALPRHWHWFSVDDAFAKVFPCLQTKRNISWKIHANRFKSIPQIFWLISLANAAFILNTQKSSCARRFEFRLLCPLTESKCKQFALHNRPRWSPQRTCHYTEWMYKAHFTPTQCILHRVFFGKLAFVWCLLASRPLQIVWPLAK